MAQRTRIVESALQVKKKAQNVMGVAEMHKGEDTFVIPFKQRVNYRSPV